MTSAAPRRPRLKVFAVERRHTHVPRALTQLGEFPTGRDQGGVYVVATSKRAAIDRLAALGFSAHTPAHLSLTIGSNAAAVIDGQLLDTDGNVIVYRDAVNDTPVLLVPGTGDVREAREVARWQYRRPTESPAGRGVMTLVRTDGAQFEVGL